MYSTWGACTQTHVSGWFMGTYLVARRPGRGATRPEGPVLATWSLWVCTLCTSTCSSLQNGRGRGGRGSLWHAHTDSLYPLLVFLISVGKQREGEGESVLVMSTWGQAGLARHLQVQSTGLYRQASTIYTALATMYTIQTVDHHPKVLTVPSPTATGPSAAARLRGGDRS